MKSEKAKKTLENSAKYVKKYRSIQGCQPIDEFVLLKNAERAVELAEQDAEMRMRKKAIEAYCIGCICYETGVCVLGPDKCVTKPLFIQKLTENEND